MLVPEVIEWLKTQDQQAHVRVLKVVPGTGYFPDTVEEVDFTPEVSYFTDFTNNPFAKDREYAGKKFLLLGET